MSLCDPPEMLGLVRGDCGWMRMGAAAALRNELNVDEDADDEEDMVDAVSLTMMW